MVGAGSGKSGVWALLAILEVLVIITALVAAIAANRRARREHPERKAFTWGYFQALGIMENAALGILGSLLVASRMPRSLVQGEVGAHFVIGILAFAIGFSMFRRKRGALVAATVISFNPVLWIINGVYLKKRWRELGKHKEKIVRDREG